MQRRDLCAPFRCLERRVDGDCIAPVTVQVRGESEVLVVGEEGWSQGSGLWRRLILGKVFLKEWIVESVCLASISMPRS